MFKVKKTESNINIIIENRDYSWPHPHGFVYRSISNVKWDASMSDIYVNNNIDAFTVLIHKN